MPARAHNPCHARSIRVSVIMKEEIPSVEERVIEGLTQFRDAIKPKVLSNRDKKAFLELIKDDKANEALQKAAKRYKLKNFEESS